jgi:hypothetical protein
MPALDEPGAPEGGMTVMAQLVESSVTKSPVVRQPQLPNRSAIKPKDK